MAKIYEPGYLYHKELDEYVPNRELFEKGSGSTTETVYSTLQFNTVESDGSFNVVALEDGLGLVTVNTETGVVRQNQQKLQYSGAIGVGNDGWTQTTDPLLANDSPNAISGVKSVSFGTDKNLLVLANIPTSGTPSLYFVHPEASTATKTNFAGLSHFTIAGDSVLLIRNNRLSISDQNIEDISGDPTQALVDISEFEYSNYAPVFSGRNTTSLDGLGIGVAVGFDNGSVAFAADVVAGTPITDLPSLTDTVIRLSIVDKEGDNYEIYAVSGNKVYSITIKRDLSEIGTWEEKFDGDSTQLDIVKIANQIFIIQDTLLNREIEPGVFVSTEEGFPMIVEQSVGGALFNDGNHYTVALGEVESTVFTSMISRGDEKIEVANGYTLNNYLFWDTGTERLEWAERPILVVTPEGINSENVFTQYNRDNIPDFNVITFQEKSRSV